MSREGGESRDVPLWLIPMFYVVASFVAAIVFPWLEHIYFPGYERGMSVSAAEAFLSSVTSGMMALTAIVFSITFLLVQYTTTAYSKRLILLLGRDPTIFHALGMFVATFTYSLGTLVYVDRGRDGNVPFLSLQFVAVLLACSMILLALLIHRVSDLRVTRALAIVGNKAREVIRETLPRLNSVSSAKSGSDGKQNDALGAPSQTLRYSGVPQAVHNFDVPGLVRAAEGAGGVIVVERTVGDTLADGATILRVFGAKTSIPEETLTKAVHVGAERTFEGDPKYPLRILVDTAIMALSPAVNDPTTAVQAIDQIEDVVHRLGERDLGERFVDDSSGRLRVILPRTSWEDYLSLAFDEIRLYGADSLQVLRRLRSALVGLIDSLDDAGRVEALRRYLIHLDETVDHSPLDTIDRATALGNDPQGLGLTRSAS